MPTGFARTLGAVSDDYVTMRHETAGERAFAPAKARLMARRGWVVAEAEDETPAPAEPAGAPDPFTTSTEPDPADDLGDDLEELAADG